tara:strand:+ start:4997 stop:6493 length:1497 start_codon:yes stop_codon:yes gene_type:complete
MATIRGDPPLSLENDLSLACSYTVEGALYIRRVSGWDGVRRLFDKANLSFPVGLITNVRAIIISHHRSRGEHADVVVVDNRPKAPVLPATRIPDMSSDLTPRPYQDWAKGIIMEEGSGLVQLPTGSGKTEVIASIIAGRKTPTIVYVHTRDLLYQMKERLERRLPGLKCGQIGDGVCEPGDVTVCMVQTVASVTESIKRPKYLDISKMRDDTDLESKLRDYDKKNKAYFMERLTLILQTLQGAGLIIYDESHHVPASTHVRTAILSRNARYRLGFSATQYRNDGAEMDIYGCLGPKIVSLDASDLIPEYLVPPTITFIEVPPMKFKSTAPYQTVYSEYVVHSEERNEMIAKQAWVLTEEGHKTIILVNRVAHGDEIMKKLVHLGVHARFIKGELDSETRHEILDQMRSGLIDVMVGTTLADEGLDIPIADSLILAGAGKSQVKTMQRVGRVLRLYPGKENAIVIDFWDRCKYLRRHSKIRHNLYMKEKAWKVTLGDTE